MTILLCCMLIAWLRSSREDRYCLHWTSLCRPFLRFVVAVVVLIGCPHGASVGLGQVVFDVNGSAPVRTLCADTSLQRSPNTRLVSVELELSTLFQPGVSDSIKEALSYEARPVVIADRADNAGGGAAGDSTFILAELLRRGIDDIALALFWDPITVNFCHAVGEGARLPLRIGSKCGPMSGDPVDVMAEVRSVQIGRAHV